MLSSQLLASITKDILDGLSLKKISIKYGCAKSTLYYHYKKLKGKRYQQPNVAPMFSEIDGEIVGIFAGDGSQYYSKKNSHYE
jgi:hypothetical protein